MKKNNIIVFGAIVAAAAGIAGGLYLLKKKLDKDKDTKTVEYLDYDEFEEEADKPEATTED